MWSHQSSQKVLMHHHYANPFTDNQNLLILNQLSCRRCGSLSCSALCRLHPSLPSGLTPCAHPGPRTTDIAAFVVTSVFIPRPCVHTCSLFLRQSVSLYYHVLWHHLNFVAETRTVTKVMEKLSDFFDLYRLRMKSNCAHQ